MPRALLLLGLALATLAAPASAQGFGKPSFGGIPDSTATSELFTRVDDGLVQAVLEVDIEDGWHLYHEDLGYEEAIGIPTTVDLGGAGIEWSPVLFPEPDKTSQGVLGGWVYTHHGTIKLYAAGILAEGAGGDDISGEIDGLTCEELGTCIPYQQEFSSQGPGDDALFADFPAALMSAAATGSFDALFDELGADADTSARDVVVDLGDTDWEAVTFPEFTPVSEDGAQTEHSLAMWLLLAFLAGMILNVMPCVLPVISIKILSFVQQAGEDRKRIFALGLAFAAGILVVFLGLAVLAVSLGLSWGEQFQSQTFLVVMIGIVFAFALSLFGVFELGVPTGVGGMAAANKEGLGDAFAKGMLATVLATPCSGPFLGSTLTWTLSQPPGVIFAIFLSLGLGMAVPYVVLTANPAWLKLLPKPGAWMETFKQAMGFVLMATVIYLMISVRQDQLLFTAAFLVFVALGAWIYGHFTGYQHARPRRLATLGVALLVVAGGGRIAFVEFAGLFEHDDSGWVEFHPDVLQAALDDGRSVFVDFTADWCPNCKVNEAVVYDADEVVRAFDDKGVLRLKADITHDNPRTDAIERLMEGLGARSIPFMALFPGDAPYAPHVRPDIVYTADVLGLIESLPEPGDDALAASADADADTPH